MDNSQNNERILQIDVKQVLTDKNPSLAKVIPGFVIRYLKRIVHQDEINDFLRQYGKLQDSEFIKAGLDSSILPTNVNSRENIPSAGRYLFVSKSSSRRLDGACFH